MEYLEFQCLEVNGIDFRTAECNRFTDIYQFGYEKDTYCDRLIENWYSDFGNLRTFPFFTPKVIVIVIKW